VVLLADLADEDLVEARVGVGPHCLDVLLGVVPAGDGVGHLLLADQLRGLLEVVWSGQHLGRRAGQQLGRPQPADGLDRPIPVRSSRP